MQTALLFTVEQYQQMVEKEILSPDERYELIEGVIFPMSPVAGPHAFAVGYLVRWFSRFLNDDYFIHSQSSLALGEYSQPESDVAVLRWRDELRTELPIPSDVLLVIEVADTSLNRDRDVKATLYARAEIPEYWIVNLQQNVIEQYQQPSSEGYNTVRIWQRGETLVSPRFAALRIPVDEVVVPSF